MARSTSSSVIVGLTRNPPSLDLNNIQDDDGKIHQPPQLVIVGLTRIHRALDPESSLG